MVGMPTRNENSVAETRLAPRIIASMIVEPEREEPGKGRRDKLSNRHRDDDRPRNEIGPTVAPGDGFHHDEDDAADNERDGDRLNGLGSLSPSCSRPARQCR